MIHFITEGGDGNKELKTHRWFLPDGIRHHLEKIKDNNKKEELTKNHTTKEAWDHLNFILGEEKGIAYNEMKRIKNWFEKNKYATKTKQYELYGGEIMKTWVENQLNSATLIVKQHKEAQRAMGKKNAFIKAHDADRQTTATKADTKVPTYNPLTLNKQNRLKELSDIKEHKTVRITETQRKLINEVINGQMKSDFFNELDKYADSELFDTCEKLCRQYLGNPVDWGSSRKIYVIDDNIILKLAYNYKGVAQNKAEVESYMKTTKYKALFPTIYSYSKNYAYILAENVIPLDTLNATSPANGQLPADVEKCLGVTSNELENIFEAFQSSECYNQLHPEAFKHIYMNNNVYIKSEYNRVTVYDFIQEHMKENANFNLLMNYLFDNPILSNESVAYQNMGMTNRNGQPWVVILDNGWDGNTAEIYGFQNFGELNL